MVFNFALSSIPGTTEQSGLLGFVPPELQNLLHLPFYGLLAWLWYRCLRKFDMTVGRSVAMAIVLSLVWSVLDEWHQYFVPGRFASLTDIAFNATGILIVAVTVLRTAKPR